MKIGILTFHKPINYGAFLQSYALSNKIASINNDEVEIIDYFAPKERKKIPINILWTFKHQGLLGGCYEISKVHSFAVAQKELRLSKDKITTSRLEVLFKYIDMNYDFLVIGSDAVFNWNQNGFPSAFIPSYNFRIPVVTYAASVHGLKFYDEPKVRIEACKKSFERQKFIGVRDKNTENFVKYCLPEAKTTHCCDPTFLIDLDAVNKLAGNYKQRILTKYGINLNQKYIVVMTQESELVRSICEHYRKEYQVISAFANNAYADKFLYDLTPFEWVMLLKGASAVVTSYFHGALLSLISGTPAYVIDRSGYTSEQYEGKLKDLMCDRLQLSDFFFEGSFEHVSPNDEFFVHFDKALSETYAKRIEESVSNERNSFKAFEEYLLKLK